MQEQKQELTFKQFFIPLTTFKAIRIIIIVGFIVYFNILFNGFVWEDNTLIINNPWGHTFAIFSLQNTFNQLGQYRPVTALYSAILYALFSTAPFFYHFIQITLHSVNSILLFLIFTRFFTKKVSLCLSLLFLVLPIQVESVSYIGAFDNLLFFLFGSMALLLSLKEKITLIRFIAVSGLLFLSILSKETGILFLTIILLYRFLFKRKFILPFIALSIPVFLFYLMRFWTGIGIGKSVLVPIDKLTLIARIINIPAIIFYYIKTFFLPVQLAVNQQWVVTAMDFQNFYLPLFLDLLFFSLLALLGRYILKTNKKDFPIFLFFLIWFLAGLFFHLQIIPLNMTVADHWFYFPIVGLLGIIGVGTHEITSQNKKFSKIATISIVAILVVFSARTMVRSANWYDDTTLFTHDSKIEDNFETETFLANTYFSQQQYNEALNHYKKSVEMYPYADNLFDLARVYDGLNDPQKAEDYYYKAIQHSKGTRFTNALLMSYENLADLLTFHNNPKEAIKLVKEALQSYPTNGRLWGVLAINEYRLHNKKEALVAAGKGKTLLPDETTDYIYRQILNNEPLQFQSP